MSSFARGAGSDHTTGNIDKCMYYITENRLNVHGKAGAFFLLVLKYMTVVNRAAGKDVLAMTSQLKYRGCGEAQKLLVPGAAGTVAPRNGAPRLHRLLPPRLREVFYQGENDTWTCCDDTKVPDAGGCRPRRRGPGEASCSRGSCCSRRPENV